MSICNRRAGLFAVVVAIATSLFSHRSDAAAEPSAERFRDLQVQVVGQGRPVLMIPGLGSSASVWRETCAALQVQCHVVQLPGFAGAPAVKQDHWLDTVRDELLAYVDQRRLDRPVVIGHSLGGVLALMMAAQAPQAVDRYVIVDSLPFLAGIRNPKATAADAQAMAVPMRKQLLEASDEQSRKQFQASAAGMTRSAERARTVVEWGMTSDRATIAQSMAELWGTDLRPLLPRIERPVLVLGSWAAYEPMGASLEGTRSLFEQQYAGLKGVQVRMSERGYHFLMWDDPDWLVSQVQAFIGR